MRLILLAAIAALSAAPLTAQAPADKKPEKPPKTLTLTGCVARGANGADLTLTDQSGSYRVTGKKISDFVGQRVQIVGSIFGKKLQIETGLKPSPNVAAQAGAIDPAQAAIAASGGSAPTGDVQLPEFRVKTVRPLGTGCQ